MILPGPKMMPMVAGGPSLNLADAAVFNGSTDYLGRSSPISADTSKTFTLSVWFNADVLQTNYILNMDPDNTGQRRFNLNTTGAGVVQLLGWTSTGSSLLYANVAGGYSVGNWCHFLASCDMSDTGKRHIYINDALASPSWNTYNDGLIDLFTAQYPKIGYRGSASQWHDGKICHLFLDATYRDLSITANRRRFNDGAGSPAAGQAGLNPQLYMPLVSSTPWGENLGTGGDFTGYGNLA